MAQGHWGHVWEVVGECIGEPEEGREEGIAPEGLCSCDCRKSGEGFLLHSGARVPKGDGEEGRGQAEQRICTRGRQHKRRGHMREEHGTEQQAETC